MSQFYDDMRALAGDLITEFKQGSIAYVQMIDGVGGTPDNPPPSVPAIWPINAVARGVQYKYVMRNLALASDLQVTFAFVTGISEAEQNVLNRLSELIQTRDAEQLTVADADAGSEVIIAPSATDFIDINSVRYKIVQIIPKPMPEPVAYTLIVRR